MIAFLNLNQPFKSQNDRTFKV